MPYCGSSVLSTSEGADKRAIVLLCGAWTCEVCGPQRKEALIAFAMAGAPNKILTLTSRRRPDQTPLEAARALVRAWRLIRRNLKHQHPKMRIEFLAIFEATKLGWPHLHILLRCGFIDQHHLAAEMLRLTDSPIVDIRAIKSRKGAAHYVSKYVGKAPGQFGKLKRFWSSKRWLPNKRERAVFKKLWDRHQLSLGDWMDAWRSFGWNVHRVTEREAIASPAREAA